MRVRNTSQYPDEAVKALLNFAARGTGTTGTVVNVKNNGKGAFAGYAYNGIPAVSNASRLKTAEYLITLRIGPAWRFPRDNMALTFRSGPKVYAVDGMFPPEPAGYDPQTWKVTSYYEGGGQFPVALRYAEPVRTPYGGKSSPLIVCADWQEGLVALAAHEFRHVYQYRHGKRRSEVDAEKHAAKRLAAYRLLRSDLPVAAR